MIRLALAALAWLAASGCLNWQAAYDSAARGDCNDILEDTARRDCLAAVERKGFLQAMLSRPIALAPITGLALGDPMGGLLLAAPLDLKVALNLDGGPVACQSVRAGGVHRVHVARWEAQEENGRAKLIYAPLGESEMPIVLVARPKS